MTILFSMKPNDSIVAVKVFRTITHIIASDVLYAHGMSRLCGV